jgi:hypothetical protein
VLMACAPKNMPTPYSAERNKPLSLGLVAGRQLPAQRKVGQRNSEQSQSIVATRKLCFRSRESRLNGEACVMEWCQRRIHR